MPTKRRGKKGLVIIGGIAGFFVLIFVIALIVLGNTANADYYKLGKDRIPSIKLVVDKRPVEKVETATSGGLTTQTIAYSNVKNPTDDLAKYVRYLIDNKDFGVTAAYNPDVVPARRSLPKSPPIKGKLSCWISSIPKTGIC